jgi:hypothetical protein
LSEAYIGNEVNIYLYESVPKIIDYKIDKGNEVWAELLKAIKQSTLFLVVFSKNYASSTWCLNELIEIMKCNNKGLYVIPVFYHIDPSHARKAEAQSL